MEDELMSAVHMVLENAPAIDKGIQKIKELTESDNTLQKLKSIIRSGIDLSEDVQSYWNFRNELSEAEGNHSKGHGIPRFLISDNGPQFSSAEFKSFGNEWGFTHITTSPYHLQANGLAEKFVQTVKRLLNKAKADHQDPYLSILEYRNTPIDNVGSPAQLLMSRRLRTCIPTVSNRLKPEVVNFKSAQAQMQQQKMQQKYYHDRGSKELPPLMKGDKAYMQSKRINHLRWDNLFNLILHYLWCKQSKRINHFELGPPVPPDSPTADINTNNNLPTSPQVEERPTPPPRTARGRLVKNPLRYTDFVES
eukprot:Em0242g3a